MRRHQAFALAPILKTPGHKRWKLTIDEPLSSFAFNFNLRRYNKEEEDADAILYRGVFGTMRKGGPLTNAFDLHQKNVANTSIMAWGGKAGWMQVADDNIPYRYCHLPYRCCQVISAPTTILSSCHLVDRITISFVIFWTG